jgi:hypothetical protein
MKATFTLLLSVLLIHNTASCQQPAGVYLSINPLAILEPQATYGLGVGYRFDQNMEIFTEYSTLKPGLFTGEGKFTNIKGYRSITQFKYTISINEVTKSKTFIGSEYRLRKYTYDDQANFTDESTGVLIKEFNFINNTTAHGFGGFIGKQWDLGEESRWCLEAFIGLGIRYKIINRIQIPSNSFIVPVTPGFAETPNYVDNHTTLYVPGGIRVMFRL